MKCTDHLVQSWRRVDSFIKFPIRRNHPVWNREYSVYQLLFMKLIRWLTPAKWYLGFSQITWTFRLSLTAAAITCSSDKAAPSQEEESWSLRQTAKGDTRAACISKAGFGSGEGHPTCIDWPLYSAKHSISNQSLTCSHLLMVNSMHTVPRQWQKPTPAE